MNTDKKKIITEALMNIEPMPLTERESTDLSEYTKIPFGALASFGVMFTPFIKTVQNIVTNNGGNLYRAVDNLGNEVTNLFAKKSGTGLKTGYQDAAGHFAQANLIKADGLTSTVTSLTYNPSALFIGAAMVSMQKEISEIKETQQQILDFLHDDKVASLRGDLLYLGTVINDYQYNLDSESYKTTAHIKVHDILQNAQHNVIFYTERIHKLADKDAFMITDKSVKNTLNKLASEFVEYRLALYLYGFSSFLNVMLLENFDENYLDSIISRLEDCSYEYRELYTRCYNLIEEQTGKSLEALTVGLIADASKGIGKFIAKIPLISRSQLDENLIKAHDTIDNAKFSHTAKIAERFLENRNGGVQTFIDNIKRINQMHNQPTEILFNSDGMYIKLVA